MEDTQQKNIDNLVSIWQLVAESFNQSSHTDNAVNHCEIKSSDWPNRIWFSTRITGKMVKAAAEIVQHASIPLTVSHWSPFEDSAKPLFEQAGFTEKSSQIGMFLTNPQKVNHSNRITLEKITTEAQANRWEEVYPAGFGYKIAAEILNRTNRLISYYLVYHNENVIGTVFTHRTGNTLGIHGLGISPAYRNQGFAEEVMARLINRAVDEGIDLIVLQSSAMGRNIYLKMGFSEDFLMTNYRLVKRGKALDA